MPPRRSFSRNPNRSGQTAANLGIGALARRSGCKVQTIRYYEQIGLMPEPARTEGRQRRYSRRHAERLTFIRHARALGFTLDQIRSLLALSDRPDRPCEEVDVIAQDNLQAVETRLASLAVLKRELERMLEHSAHGRVSDCRIIEVLFDHGLCGGEHGGPPKIAGETVP